MNELSVKNMQKPLLEDTVEMELSIPNIGAATSSREKFSLASNNYELNLPPLKNYHYTDYLPKPENPIDEVRNQVFKTLEVSHYFWECPVPKLINPNSIYKFELPLTNFKQEGNINYIELPQYKFHSERQSLNATQRKEIWEERSFTVPSEMENLPHTWKISKWLLHSSKERTMFFKKTLSTSMRLFYAVPNVVNPFSERVIRVDVVQSLARPNIFNVVINIVTFFLNIFDFFFGFKYRTLPSNYEYTAKQNVNKNAMRELYYQKEKLPLTYDLVEGIKTEEISKQINELHKQFESKFNAELKKELNMDDYEDEEIEIIRRNIIETKQDKLYEFIEEILKSKSYPKVLEGILNKIRAFNIYQTLEREQRNKINAEKEKFKQKLEKERPIFYLIGYKRQRTIEQLLSPVQKEIEKEFREKLEKELVSMNLYEELFLMKNYFTFSENEPTLIDSEIKTMRKTEMKPVNKFMIKYPLFECQYKPIKDTNSRWKLVKERELIIYSNFVFYKVVKALASYFIKLYSLMFKIAKWVWEGRFGIKCLFLCNEFYSGYTINHTTGNIQKNQKRIRPILRCFLGVLHGIQKSRKRFEQAPDDAFFGKNFGRVLNILYCILFRFIFAGIIVMLIIHPIVNILCIVGGMLAAITTLVWLVFVEVFLLTWKLIFYDYKSTLRHHYYQNHLDQKVQFYEHSHLKLLKSYKWFTLIHLVYDFLMNVIIQFVMVIVMILFSPLISVLVLVLGVTLYIIKCFWDWLILNTIIRCFARVPSSNSTFAYRTSGPGISRDFYNTLERKDLILLIISHLESLELDQVLKEGNSIIEYPRNFMDSQCSLLFKKFLADNSRNIYMNESFNNIEFLKNSLRQCIYARKNELPKISGGHHTVRFTKEEIEKNEIVIEEVLKDVIKEKKMDRYIWEYYDLRPGLYKRLTRKVLQNVLCGEAINPVENIDHVERVKFEAANTKFSQYISKFSDEDYDFMRKKKERAYIRRVDNNKAQTETKIYVSIESVLQFYLTDYIYYVQPFLFTNRPQEFDKQAIEVTEVNFDIQDRI